MVCCSFGCQVCTRRSCAATGWRMDAARTETSVVLHTASTISRTESGARRTTPRSDNTTSQPHLSSATIRATQPAAASLTHVRPSCCSSFPQPCTDLARDGSRTCTYGKRCNYAHPGQSIRRVSTGIKLTALAANSNHQVAAVELPDGGYMDAQYIAWTRLKYPTHKHPFGMFM